MKSRDEILVALKRHSFFRSLSDEELAAISAHATHRSFAAGAELTHEGDDARHFFAILRGKVAVQTFVTGRGLCTLQTLHDGELLGWSWVFPPRKWTFDARALVPTEALEFDGAAVMSLCEEDPRLGFRLMKSMVHVMTERLRATRLQLLDIYGTEPSGPVNKPRP